MADSGAIADGNFDFNPLLGSLDRYAPQLSNLRKQIKRYL